MRRLILSPALLTFVSIADGVDDMRICRTDISFGTFAAALSRHCEGLKCVDYDYRYPGQKIVVARYSFYTRGDCLEPETKETIAAVAHRVEQVNEFWCGSRPSPSIYSTWKESEKNNRK